MAPSATDPRLVVALATVNGMAVNEYAGAAFEQPAEIVLCSADTDAARTAANGLLAALQEAVIGLGATIVPPSHVDRDLAAMQSRLASNPSRGRAVLVLVGDEAKELGGDPVTDWWRQQPIEHFAILPVLKSGSDVPAAFPATLRHLNVRWWSESTAECVDDVLALARVTTDDRRVFVSYRRKDSANIAEQLFEELQKRRFEVFVDVFSVPPGVDFQERLTDELARKSMVLVLESPGMRDSEWVAHEIGVAKKHELGRLAVHLPSAGPSWQVDSLDDAFRLRLKDDEVNPPIADRDDQRLVTETHTLTPGGLARIVDRLITEHTRAYLRRRGFLLDALRKQLQQRGVHNQELDPQGHLKVEVWDQHGQARRYVMWATPRPPDVEHFRTAHGACAPGPEPVGVILTTVLYGEKRRREVANWLASVSLVHLTDQGRLGELADSIARGQAL